MEFQSQRDNDWTSGRKIVFSHQIVTTFICITATQKYAIYFLKPDPNNFYSSSYTYIVPQ